MHHLRTALSLCVTMFLLGACGNAPPTDDSQGTAAAPRGADAIVDVVGTEYAFHAPERIPSGWTTFRLRTEGAEVHNMTVVRLKDGHTVADLMEALRTDPARFAEMGTALGGPNAAPPGGTANATLMLEPGSYALVCFVPSPDDHVPHVFKGMVAPLTVTGEASGAPAPDLELEMGLLDFAFDFPSTVAAGTRTIRVANRSMSEPHEIILARLGTGKTVDDLAGWIDNMDGPPPAEFMGGVAAIDPGESAVFTADLTPGEYALICPLRKGEGDTPHHLRGMLRQFTVE